MDKDKAVQLFYAEQWHNAAELFTDLVELEPDSPETYYYLQLCLLLQEEKVEIIPLPNEGKIYLIEFLAKVAAEFCNVYHKPAISLIILQQSFKLDSQNPDTLRCLASFYQSCRRLSEAFELAKQYRSVVTDLPNQIFANFMMLTSQLTTGGEWQDVFRIAKDQMNLMQSFTEFQPLVLKVEDVVRLHVTPFFLPYINDNPRVNRSLQNAFIAQCKSLVEAFKVSKDRYPERNLSESKKIKVGYISYCLKKHSVGWLSRWLFEHHDSEEFEIYIYFVLNKPESVDPIQSKIAEKAFKFYKLGVNYYDIADQIYQDAIDILVDIDSITFDATCQVMALKPAPIQVTWLGLDASGIPSVDYFIADPYVLPENAQDYYSEKIWRLPNTYIAVDGFEVLFPTLTRNQLDLPKDAIVFMSTQAGLKRHPDTVKLQMQVLKGVPDSYLLIKGIADQGKIKESFEEIAQEVGVSCDRLRFLPMTPGEQEHRANLAIADVVLDTYPYNGATTTMETLWMCIPMVTKVGQQFAARNSYTMMMNAGITEGIAWNDQEYVDWGIRLGTDENLRKQVFWKLKESRKTSPLWNAKQFTRDMENAYRQMWAEKFG